MKVAFDCMGTLMTENQRVLMLYKAFEELGHEMFIWSSEYSFTTKTKTMHNLQGETMTKLTKWDCGDDKSNYMDIAIDDQEQTYLATHRLVLVEDIPAFKDLDEAKKFAKELMGENHENV